MQPYERTGAILVVDDQAEIRRLVGRLLEAAGYNVILAADGSVGLACFKRHRAAIALLLTDVIMPNMDGLELADHVTELDARLPILFMSGSDLNADRGYGCLPKPFTGEHLLSRVQGV